ncbi:1503_t:CDS:1, partial [Racocetra fulgida]
GGGPFQAKKEKALGAEAIAPIAKAFKRPGWEMANEKRGFE